MISCVVLTYNRCNALNECLNSIWNSTKGADIEIIVVNNASTDNTNAVLIQQQSMHSNLRVHNTLENIGVIARNFGFELARGEYIAQIDDDVCVMPGWIENAMQCFKSDNSVGAVGPMAAKWINWNNAYDTNTRQGDYVDFLTGMFWIFKNESWRYDNAFGKFWHEESDLQMKMRYEKQYRFKVACRGLFAHKALRGNVVDWSLHNKNYEYFAKKWQPLEDKLNLEGKHK